MRHIKLYEEFLNEEFDEVNEARKKAKIDNAKIEKALKRKSEATGIPITYLRTVMRRGMAAWKSGHRPGAGQEQWGYARVNSFCTGKPTTWGSPKKSPKGGADSDVAKKVIKNGHTEKLKFLRGLHEDESSHKYFRGLSKSTIEAKKKQMKKQADMEDDNPRAYKLLPGDVKGKSKLRKSKHTKSFEEMYGDEMNQK